MIMPAEIIRTTKSLGDLLQGFGEVPSIEIAGIASDSRLLDKGYLFLACAGERSHGLDYIDSALAAGVAAIAYDSDTGAAPESDIGIPMLAIPGLASLLGEIANRFYESPSEDIDVFGVTGTNGKTTVAWLAAQCWNMLDRQCAYIGTLGSGLDRIDGGEGVTTPGAVELHGLLAGFRDAGAKAAAIEVSSHALAQNRVDRVSFDTVLFTNLSRDHLDYHGDMQSYAEEKARLFTQHRARHRIVNLDSEFGMELASRCGQQVVTVSTHFDRVANGRPYVFARSVVVKNDGSLVRISSSWGDGEFMLPLPGDFNVANAVIVLALLLNRGIELERACDALSRVSAPPGRMQRVAPGDGLPDVYVDYAHSPVAIEVALRALRAHCRGRLWCVFGCGGDRDAGKRPMMAKAAERLADHIVITNDNPRTESPTAIVNDIISGLANAEAATVIEDRAAAIAWAIAEAGDNDVVLIAGKGHENYQLIGTETIEFSDYGAAEANIGARAEGRR